MTTIKGSIEFYKRSSADILVALDGDGAGTLWTIPPCSPDALRQGIRQMVRTHTTRVQWTRKVRIRSRANGSVDAVAVYELPAGAQKVFQLDTAEEIQVGLLRDACLEAGMAELGGDL
jgi:hypothetical protein